VGAFYSRKKIGWTAERSPDAAADLVGEAHIDRNRSLIMGSEDFAYMLEACPGAFINIGIGNTDGPLHNPRYDFNDAALPIGASVFARLVEKKLPRL
jgi:metal-dependent amidase/aminoacylase/carboxypeptidase family protein